MKGFFYELRHVTRTVYPSPVLVSHHLFRLAPRRMRRQLVLEHVVDTEPGASAVSCRQDYFGNEVQYVTLEGAHTELSVTARSRLVVGAAYIPDPGETPSWEVVRRVCRTDRSRSVMEANEFTFASPMVPVGAEYAAYAAESFRDGRSLLESALELTRRIHKDFVFDPSATTTTTPLEEVMRERRGVCQDFAHLEIACLRSLGLAARYVSGYLETIPPPGQERLVGGDMSHAWVSLYCPGLGWMDLDPTNDCMPSMRYVTLGWGRDYGDVSPTRGVLIGAGEHSVSVAVDVVPLGEACATPARGEGDGDLRSGS